MISAEPITNLVFMGMGEPLLNFEEVKRAIEILSDDHGLGIPRRKITVSTAGYVPHILRVGKELRTNLAVSLVAATDEKRARWMSINKRYPISLLMETLKSYIATYNRKVFIEYILINGETDTDEDLRNLLKLLRNVRVTVNLIPYNENTEFKMLRRSPPDRVEHFRRELLRQEILATVRWSYGSDIKAACGQLAGMVKGNRACP
jgi:23S rRNA (adenine2503-C2)-methyltransferase